MNLLRRLLIGDNRLDVIKRLPIKRLRLTQPDKLSPEMTLLQVYERTIHTPEFLGVVQSVNPKSVIGIVTPGDVDNYNRKQGMAGKQIDLGKTSVDTIMNKNYVFVDENKTVDDVRAKLLDHNLRKVLVLDQAKKNPRVITRESLASQIRQMGGIH